MRSADLTARARIRDAAVRRFGTDGFGATVRQIAADAGVSPALVIHHFASKDGLRHACDEYVVEVVGRDVATTFSHADPQAAMARVGDAQDYAPFAAYLTQALMAGGAFAADLLDGVHAATVDYVREGIALGRVRPQEDVATTARLLVALDLGLLLTAHVQASAGRAPGVVEEPAAALADMTAVVPAVLELYTRGLFTDSSYLDAYRAHQATQKEQR